MTALILLITLLVAAMVITLSWPRKQTSVLDSAYKVDDIQDTAPDMKSIEYQLQAGGVNMTATSFKSMRIGAMLIGFVAGSMMSGPLLGLVMGGLAFYFPTAWLKNKAASRGLEIDKHMPVAVGRVASGLMAGMSISDALLETADSLDAQGKNPLSAELRQTAAEINARSRDEGLRNLAERSPSVSLANFAMMLQGQGTTGGSAYGTALMDISERVQGIIGARNRAYAKAQDSMTTVAVIPGLLALMVAYMSTDPLIGASLRTFTMQAIIAGAAVAMTVGYFVMQDITKEAL